MRKIPILLVVTVSLCAGIVLEKYLSFSFWIIVCLNVVCFLLSVIFLKRRMISNVFLILAFIFLGILLTKNHYFSPADDVAHIGRFYRGSDVRVEGTIVSDVQKRDFHKTKKLTFELAVRRFETRWGWKQKSGKILVHVFGDRDLSYGTVVRLTGKMFPAFDFKSDSRFSYKKYLLNRKIVFIFSVKGKTPMEILGQDRGHKMMALAIHLKHRLKTILERYLSPTEAFLMSAILTGDRHQIPSYVKDLFARTGTAHILAISGLHVGIVAFLFFFFLKFFVLSRRVRSVLTIFFLIFYALLTGARPSVVRATIMAVVYLFGFLIERESDTLNSLSLAAFLILCFNPTYLFDIGFQLSFLSVLSILLIYPIIARQFLRKKEGSFKLKRYLIQPMLFSFSIWIGIGVLIAYFFQIVSPVMVVANFFVVPFLAVIVALGAGLLLTGWLWPWAAEAFAMCLKMMIQGIIGGTYVLSQIPGAYVQIGSFSIFWVWAYYVLLVLALIVLNPSFAQQAVYLYNYLKHHQKETQQ